jgi:MFS family permease
MDDTSAPKRFYGWVIVAALSVAGGFSMAMGIGNFGVFVTPMSEDLGIGQAPFGWALSARLVGFAATGPIVGRLIDRHGTRGPFAIAITIFAVSVASLGLVTAGWQLVGMLFFMGMLGFWGSSTLYLTIPVAKWFIVKRGKAMSLVFIGVPVGIGISAPVSQALINAVGWRASWAIIGLVAGTVILLLALVVLRNDPESMGLLPDGETPREAEDSSPSRAAAMAEYPWTVHEAVRTGAFWRLAIAFGTVMMGMGAIGLFWIPYFADKGFDPQLAAWGFTAYAWAQAGGSALLAPLIDRFQPRFLALVGFATFIAAFLLVMAADTNGQMFAAAALAGVGVGIGMLLQAQMWPSYFGRSHIGAIRGAAVPLTILFSGSGASATGMIFDATGTYEPAWWGVVTLLFVGAALIAVTPKPQPAAAAASEGV